jgi:hypothetical protein
MTIDRIFLDLDGVLVDFIGGVIKRHQLDCTPADCTEWGTVLEVYKKQYPGASNRNFWDSLGRDFWLGLEFYPWANELLEYLTPFKPIILTAPTLNNAGWKQEFIRNNLPEFFNDKRYIITPSHTKHVLARPSALLIDDRITNVKDFKKSRGLAMLWPQPWNTPSYTTKIHSGPFAVFKSRMNAVSKYFGFVVQV